jgi:hypothetical protein
MQKASLPEGRRPAEESLEASGVWFLVDSIKFLRGLQQ